MAFQQLYIRGASKVHGPFEPARVRAAVAKGEITPQHQVSFDGKSWFAAANIWLQLADTPAPPPPVPAIARAAALPPDAVFTAVPVLDGEEYSTDYYGDSPSAELLDPQTLGSIAQIALAVLSITATLLLLLMTVTVLSLLGTDASRPSVSSAGNLKVLVYGTATCAVILILQSVVALVVVALWTRQANLALRAVGERELQVTPLLAAVWWFIPIFNLVLPFLTLREIVDRSRSRGVPSWRIEDARRWLHAWWTTAVIAFAASALGTFFRWHSSSAPKSARIDVAAATQFAMFWGIGQLFLITVLFVCAYYTVVKVGPIVSIALVDDDDEKEE